ncbi:MAG: hypothetical protein EAZ43_13625 [Betaproteobacteria bacterium]|nr:MAG: hypothetical protein EAZ43_13625 [Betaproteobacteria bacterium]
MAADFCERAAPEKHRFKLTFVCGTTEAHSKKSASIFVKSALICVKNRLRAPIFSSLKCLSLAPTCSLSQRAIA